MLKFVCFCAAQVCPANWKPGDKTIIADPERSLDYFEKAHKVGDVQASLLSSAVLLSNSSIILSAVVNSRVGSEGCVGACGLCRLERVLKRQESASVLWP
jgi:hypothetical protein